MKYSVFIFSLACLLSAEAFAQEVAKEKGEGAGEEPIDMESLLMVDPVVVQSTPIDVSRVGGSANVITQKELERFEYDDVHQVLKQVPGVYVRQEDGFGLRPNIGMRGVNSDRSSKVNLMEDDVLLGPAPYSAQAAYYFPLSIRMVGMEVFKGPGSIPYGPNTIGGAINWLTRPIPEQSEGDLDLSVGQYRSGRFHGNYGMRSKYAGFLIDGVHLQSDGFKNLDGGGNTGFDKNEMLAKFQINTDPDELRYQSLELRLGYSNETSNETYLGLSDADFAATPYRRYAASQLGLMDWWRTQIQVRHYLRISDSIEVKTTAYRHDFSRSWRKLNRFSGGPALFDVLNQPFGQAAVYESILQGQQDSEGPDQNLMVGINQRDFVSQGIQSTTTWSYEKDWFSQQLELGFRFHYDEIKRNHTEDPYRMLASTLVPTQDPRQLILQNQVKTNAWSFHTLDRIQLGESLLLTPGLRVEMIDWQYRNSTDATAVIEQNDFYTVLIPGIGAVYQLIPELSVLAGVHRGFSPAAPGPEKNAKPETSVNYEAGLRFSKEQSKAELVGFFNDYSNMTAVCSFNRGCSDESIGSQTNAGSVFVYGLEASASQDLPLWWDFALHTQAAYTLTLSDFQNDFTSSDPLLADVSKGDALPYIPVHQLNFIVGVNHPTWGVDLSGTYVGEMRDVAGQGPIPTAERINDYIVFDLAGRYKLSDKHELYARIDNLFDNEYMVSRRPYGLRPGKPFLFMVGYKGHFGP
ncbi:MAG: TonB-dependent receptor [Myxococcales bacterium]|nr:MAG: TonB-dependent receptor [Myxococcales bacterium]